MEEIFTILVYIIEANIAYLIFSLFIQGFKHYSNYIAELIFLLILTIYLTLKGLAIGWVFLIALIGILLIVFIPFIIQGQIDRLIEDNCYNEIASLAKLKASLAWSYPNSHLQEMAEIADEYYEQPEKMLEKLRGLLGIGEPYDSMTRMFLGMIHFNKRDFSDLVMDLKIPNEDFSKQSFEELLYLVRGYLETTRYDEAVQAQYALEDKVYEDELSDKKIANAIVNRFVFYAFMGWTQEYDALLNDESVKLDEGLPSELRNFWRGVCWFYSGDYISGVKQMQDVIDKLPDERDIWREFMSKRLHGMLDNKEFFDQHVLPKLRKIHDAESAKLCDFINAKKNENVEIPPVNKVNNILSFIILVLSTIWLVVCNVNDNVEVVKMGANGFAFFDDGDYYRLFTYMFIHSGWTHLIMNLIALRYFGVVVETIAGWQYFIATFFVSGIVGGLFSVWHGTQLSIGASGGVMGLLGAAFVFCMMKTRISRGVSNQVSLSTLIFIIIINIAFGIIENGRIDNFCHLGGIIAGLCCALLYLPAIKFKKLQIVYQALSVVFCIAIVIGAFIGYFGDWKNNAFYPAKIKDFQVCESPNKLFSVEMPQKWIRKDLKKDNSEEISFDGCVNEYITCTAAAYSGNQLDIIKEIINEKTRSFESIDNVELVSVNGPNICSFRDSTYSVKWLLKNSGYKFTIEDFFIFNEDCAGYIKFQTYTEHVDEYTPILKKIINSFKFNIPTILNK